MIPIVRSALGAAVFGAALVAMLPGCGGGGGEPSGTGTGAGGAPTSSVSGTGGAGGMGTASSAGTGGAGTGGVAGTPSYYGTPWSADSLQNWNIGSDKKQRWSYRFRAPRAGNLDHFRVFFVTNPEDHSKAGYSDGNGGMIHIELCDDDGTALHAPQCTKPHGTTDTGDFGLDQGSPASGHDKNKLEFRTLKLAAPVAIEAGKLYHFVFSNIDPNPEANWIGLDGLVEFGTSTPAPMRPSFTDWGLLLGVTDKPGWIDWTTGNTGGKVINTPVLAVAYDDGFSFGCGYMEVWPGDSQVRAVDSKGSVRERFVPSEDVTVTGLGVRIQRTSNVGSLVARLETEGGQFVDEATIPAASVDDTRHSWVSATFGGAHTLTKGITYHLVLQAKGGASFQTFCVRDGQTWGFEKGSVFGDGYAEFDRGDGQGFLGWYGWSVQGDPAYKDGDLQLYFVTK